MIFLWIFYFDGKVHFWIFVLFCFVFFIIIFFFLFFLYHLAAWHSLYVRYGFLFLFLFAFIIVILNFNRLQMLLFDSRAKLKIDFQTFETENMHRFHLIGSLLFSLSPENEKRIEWIKLIEAKKFKSLSKRGLPMYMKNKRWKKRNQSYEFNRQRKKNKRN